MRSHRVLAPVIGGVTLAILMMAGCAGGQHGVAGDEASRPTSPRVNAMTYFAHGHLLERQGNFGRAAEQYMEAIARQPSMIGARNRLGITLNKLGRHAEASDEFRKAISINPNLAHLRNNLGFSLLLEGKHFLAEKHLREAIEMNPNFKRARMNHGIAMAKLGRLDEAFEEFSAICSQADAYYNIAMLHADAGHYSSACAALQQALIEDPEMTAAEMQLEQLAGLAEEEQKRAAEAAAARAAALEAQQAALAEAAALAAAEHAAEVEATEVVETAHEAYIVEHATEIEEHVAATPEETSAEMAAFSTVWTPAPGFFETPVKLNGIIEDGEWPTDAAAPCDTPFGPGSGISNWDGSHESRQTNAASELSLIIEQETAELLGVNGFRPARPMDEFMTAAHESPLMSLRVVRPDASPEPLTPAADPGDASASPFDSSEIEYDDASAYPFDSEIEYDAASIQPAAAAQEPIGSPAQLRAAIEDVLMRNETIVQLFLAVQGWIDPDVAFEVADDVAEIVQEGMDQVWLLEHLECRQLDEEAADAAENTANAPALTSERPNR